MLNSANFTEPAPSFAPSVLPLRKRGGHPRSYGNENDSTVEEIDAPVHQN